MNVKKIVQLQKELSEIIGVSGREQKVAEFIMEKMEGLVDKIWRDPLGNILAVKEGSSASRDKRILLDAHTDEIGFMISHVDKKGFLRFVTIGGWDERLFPGSPVLIEVNSEEPISGIIGTLPPHVTKPSARKKVIPTENLFIDIGAESKDEVQKRGIDIGSVGTLGSSFRELPNGYIQGKAFDDRIGINVLIQVASILNEQEMENSLCYNFAFGEEVGLRGAATGAYTLDPDLALAIESTTATDVPGVPEHKVVTSLGKGPAITVADRSIIPDRRIVDRLCELADELKIPWQYKKPAFGGTDAGAIHRTKGGIPSGVVACPCRYIHSPIGLLKISDLLHMIDLVSTFCKYKIDFL